MDLVRRISRWAGLLVLLTMWTACGSGGGQQGADGAGTAAIGQPIADAANPAPPSGDPHDDAPSVDVPTADSPPVRTGGAAFSGTANGTPWPIDSIVAHTGPNFLSTHEQLTIRFIVGHTGVPGARLTLRLPLTPENVASVPVRIPIDGALAAELGGFVATGVGAARLLSRDTPTDLTGWKHRSFSTDVRGEVTILALDRAGRTVSGRFDVHFNETQTTHETDFRPVEMHVVGAFQNARY